MAISASCRQAVDHALGEVLLLDQDGSNAVRADLVQLVDRPHDRADVLDPEALVEALDQPAVVELHGDRRHREAGERLRHHLGDLDVVVEGQRVPADHVDVGLPELAVPALLGPLAAPGLLDLVAAERELEVAGVLQDVPRERHGEVEVQRERVVRPLVGVQPPDGVDLLVDLALAQQLVQRLDRPRLQRREAGQLERVAQLSLHLLLDEALGRQPLREPGQRSRPLAAAHATSPRSSRYGLVARSRPIVVAGPWPGSTSRSSGSGEHDLGQGPAHGGGVTAGRVVAADAAGEQHVAAEHRGAHAVGRRALRQRRAGRTARTPRCARARGARRCPVPATSIRAPPAISTTSDGSCQVAGAAELAAPASRAGRDRCRRAGRPAGSGRRCGSGRRRRTRRTPASRSRCGPGARGSAGRRPGAAGSRPAPRPAGRRPRCPGPRRRTPPPRPARPRSSSSRRRRRESPEAARQETIEQASPVRDLAVRAPRQVPCLH